DCEQPGVRSLRDPFCRPVFQCGQHCVLHQILRGGEISCDVDERCDQPACVLAQDPRQVFVDVLGHMGAKSMGRISTTGQPGQFLAACSASSRSATSISTYPLTTSLPSTNGPSVMTGSPWSRRTVVAVSAAFSLLPPLSLSEWLANHSLTRSIARSRS